VDEKPNTSVSIHTHVVSISTTKTPFNAWIRKNNIIGNQNMGQVTHQKSYSKIYRTWIAMLSRCRNPNDNNYKHYGARGIQVCERWYTFENFYEDMGDHPFYWAQIDRIDNEKGYSPDNCRWISAKENSRNRRTTKRHGGIVQQELIEKIGWTKNQFRWYAKRYGIDWILENFKADTLPLRYNMPVNKDEIIGKTFSKWYVLSFISYKRGEGNRYLCRCQCGLEKEVVGYYLRSGKSTGCHSCAYKRQKNKPNPKKPI